MKDWSDDPSHHEQTLVTTELHLAPCDAEGVLLVDYLDKGHTIIGAY